MEYYDRIKNKPLQKIYKIVVMVQRAICYVAAISVPLIIVYQVILRYVLKAPLMGIEELLIFPIIWLYMMGGSVASEQRNHISCGILTLYIKKEKSMLIFNCFKNVISFGVCCWLTRWAFWFFEYSLKLWKTSDILHIPMFFAESAMFIGLVFMLIFTAIELFDDARSLIQCGKEKQAE